jgi:hypothetical protein
MNVFYHAKLQCLGIISLSITTVVVVKMKDVLMVSMGKQKIPIHLEGDWVATEDVA